jgi:hypothetical protein
LAVAGPAGLPMTRAARAPLSGPLRGMALLGVGFCPLLHSASLALSKLLKHQEARALWVSIPSHSVFPRA